MKKIIAFLFLFQLSFGQTSLEAIEMKYNDSIVKTLKFDIGDVDNDNIKDLAFAVFLKNKETNKYARDVVNVMFSNGNFDLAFYPCEAIYIKKIEDIDNDGSNEIIIFSKTHEGWWNEISVWSLKKPFWKNLASTNGFCSEDKDFKNRVIKINDEYFLIGETWDLDEKGDFDKIKVKIK